MKAGDAYAQQAGEAEAQADGLVCKDVLELEIFLAVRSSYAGADRHPETEGADTAALLETDLHGSERSFEVLKQGTYCRVSGAF